MSAYSNWHSSFWDEFKNAITPELKLQVCDAAAVFVKSAFTGITKIIALAFIGILRATVRVPK